MQQSLNLDMSKELWTKEVVCRFHQEQNSLRIAALEKYGDHVRYISALRILRSLILKIG
jgi:hypothetical protein